MALAAMSGIAMQGRVHAKGAANVDADRAAITEVLTRQALAWNDGNVDAFLTGYWNSPELTFSGSSGVARGWDGVLASVTGQILAVGGKFNRANTLTWGKTT